MATDIARRVGSMSVTHDSETSAQGQQVITACALIHHEFDGITKIFLPKRAATKKFLPGVHEIPGGHIDFGENIVAGLQREIMEEFGVRIRVGDPFYVFDYRNDVKGSHSVEIIYFATLKDSPDEIHINSDDHEIASWFSENELPAAYLGGKDSDDAEFVAVRKGFAILAGEPYDTATVAGY